MAITAPPYGGETPYIEKKLEYMIQAKMSKLNTFQNIGKNEI